MGLKGQGLIKCDCNPVLSVLKNDADYVIKIVLTVFQVFVLSVAVYLWRHAVIPYDVFNYDEDILLIVL